MTKSGSDLLRGADSGGATSSPADGGVTFTTGAVDFLSLLAGLLNITDSDKHA